MDLEVVEHTDWWPAIFFPPINLWSVWPRSKKMNKAINILKLLEETRSDIIIESNIYYMKNNTLFLRRRVSNDLEFNTVITKPLHEILEVLNKLSEEEYIKLKRKAVW